MVIVSLPVGPSGLPLPKESWTLLVPMNGRPETQASHVGPGCDPSFHTPPVWRWKLGEDCKGAVLHMRRCAMELGFLRQRQLCLSVRAKAILSPPTPASGEQPPAAGWHSSVRTRKGGSVPFQNCILVCVHVRAACRATVVEDPSANLFSLPSAP